MQVGENLVVRLLFSFYSEVNTFAKSIHCRFKSISHLHTSSYIDISVRMPVFSSPLKIANRPVVVFFSARRPALTTALTSKDVDVQAQIKKDESSGRSLGIPKEFSMGRRHGLSSNSW